MISDVATWAGAALTLKGLIHPRRAHLTELSPVPVPSLAALF